MPPIAEVRGLALASLAAAAVFTAGCATFSEPEGPLRKETVYAVTGDMQLITFNAGQPRRILARQPVSGLGAGERLVGIDYRVARGVMYALSADTAGRARLYTVNPANGVLTAVGSAPSAQPLSGRQFGFDFNPAADRIRVVSDSGQNLRLHPDTGAAVDGDATADGLQPDGPLRYARDDVNAGRAPMVAAAGYTYNKQNEKITTNYAIDLSLGALVMQGSIEGASPAVSPNTGLLTTVGTLGLGKITDAAFDIDDLSNAPFVAVRTERVPRTQLHLLDLRTGRATLIGTVGDGAPLLGLAVEP
jgi:hypothetical protein